MSRVEQLPQVVHEVGGRVRQYLTMAAGSLGLTGGRALSGPLHAEIGISDPCNHKCVMCYNYPPDDRQSEATQNRFGLLPAGLMSLETFKSVVDDLYGLGTRRVDLVARGEPLLNRAAVEMVTYAKQRGMHVILCTNASKLSAEKADGLVKAGLDRMNVSLNAGTPENYPNIHVTETPENYLKVKRNLRYLTDSKTAQGKTQPFLRLSFVIGTQNYFEIQEMVEVTHEVGATEAHFVHNQVQEKTRDLALSVEQYDELSRSILPRAKARATDLGVATNLATFGATVPLYLTSEVKGPPVVPCYVGYYFTVVLGNGTVLPCCQCSNPIDTVSKTRSFADIWASEAYSDFRKAAKNLPEPSDRLKTCECDQCYLRPRNISIHNLLHPWNRIEGGDDEQMFSVSDLVRMVKQGSSVKVRGSE
jgi:MoaA/NifB/PqqE/SkfB family radical SAM enzyme